MELPTRPHLQASHFKGDRVLTLTDVNDAKPLNHFDQARLAFERWLGQPVDWHLLRETAPTCSSNEVIASWGKGGRKIVNCTRLWSKNC